LGNFYREFPQLRLSELIENSVGLPATTSQGNAPSQNTCLSATLPLYAREEPTSCFAHELPFSVVNAGQPTSYSIEALYTSIGGTPVGKFSIECCMGFYC